MKYRNTVTGAIVDVKSKIGGNWEALESPKPTKKVESVNKDNKKKETKK